MCIFIYIMCKRKSIQPTPNNPYRTTPGQTRLSPIITFFLHSVISKSLSNVPPSWTGQKCPRFITAFTITKIPSPQKFFNLLKFKVGCTVKLYLIYRCRLCIMWICRFLKSFRTCYFQQAKSSIHCYWHNWQEKGILFAIAKKTKQYFLNS